MTSKKPLNTDKTTISKAVPTVTPAILIIVSVRISVIRFFENKYRFAMRFEVFKESSQLVGLEKERSCKMKYFGAELKYSS